MQPLSAISTWLPLAFIVLLLVRDSFSQYMTLLYTVSESVGAGNFTHIKLNEKGHLNLVLESTKGDADLYISDASNSQPSWAEYDFQSATCGDDVLDISSDMKRPVYIGIYGHPSHDTSEYILRIFSIPVLEETYDSIDRESSSNGGKNSKAGSKKNSSSDPKEEEESLIWTIFISILKILLDVLVS